MAGNHDDLSDTDLSKIWEHYQNHRGIRADAEWEAMRQAANNPRYNAIVQQKVRLKGNGLEMDFGTVRMVLALLREMKEKEPDQFASLVLSVRPRGATCLPKTTVQMVIGRKALVERGMVSPDGLVVHPEFAAILDTAYAETKEGVILRDPVIPPSKEFLDELIAAERQVDRQIILSVQQKMTKEDRRKRGKGEGPSF
jgi:hypothetical protein